MKILAFDQATRRTGYALYDNGQLIEYGLLESTGTDADAHMADMYWRVLDLIERCAPDCVGIEGVQFQNNFHTYAVLARMQGAIMGICYAHGIDIRITGASEWRSFCGIRGRARKEQKAAAVQTVASDGIYASEDVCEAILHGRYLAHKMRKDFK